MQTHKEGSIQLFVPGRLCLFGEHSDWAGSYRMMNAALSTGTAIVVGIEQGIYAEVRASDRFTLTSSAPEIRDIWKDFSAGMDLDELGRIAGSGLFFSYCAGVASYVMEHYRVGGLHIHLTSMTLPMKRGLSSSAAICVLVARAFNLIYGLNISERNEMEIAYRGELRTASRCGRLDQVCAFGGCATLMSFDGDETEVTKIVIKETLHWVFADLNASKDTIKILRELNRAFPFASNEKERNVQTALGELNLETVRRAVEYMKSGDVEALGSLMTEAQEVFDTMVAPMCPDELDAPVLHRTLEDTHILPLVYGGKGVGSQGDGSVQFLARNERCQKQLVEYLESLGMHAYSLTIKPRHTVRKAIIPVAGFGTRLYPETRIIKKDFFPVVDRDGLVKPAILVLLEELVDSGIEQICLILGSREERRLYSEFFESELPREHLDKLNARAMEYEKRILDIGRHIEYVYQHERRGFGHAVYQAAGFAGDEPVLLLLGDTIYKAKSGKSCTLQFIEEFERYNRPMVSIHRTPLSDVSYYGIITGVWEDSTEKVMEMSGIIEKPSAAYAEEHLGVKGADGRDSWWSVFGQYILTPDVFLQLAHDIEDAGDSRREIELSSALEKVRSRSGMTAVRIDGEMFDLGHPKAYRNAIMKFCE